MRFELLRRISRQAGMKNLEACLFILFEPVFYPK